jgi:CheY-like chemotaxis protein
MNDTSQKRLFRKVMVIDDSKTDRFIVSYMLKKFNLADEIIEVESAKKALDYFKSAEAKTEELPQLIFLDIRMPEMDGFGFLEEYDKLPEGIKSNCIIMMLSTSLDTSDRAKAEGNHYVARFLNKPLDIPKIEWLKQEFRQAS